MLQKDSPLINVREAARGCVAYQKNVSKTAEIEVWDNLCRQVGDEGDFHIDMDDMEEDDANLELLSSKAQ